LRGRVLLWFVDLCVVIRPSIATLHNCNSLKEWVYIDGNIVHLTEEKAITIEATSSLDCQVQIKYIDQEDNEDVDDDPTRKNGGHSHNIIRYRRQDGEGEVDLQVHTPHPIITRVIIPS